MTSSFIIVNKVLMSIPRGRNKHVNLLGIISDINETSWGISLNPQNRNQFYRNSQKGNMYYIQIILCIQGMVNFYSPNLKLFKTKYSRCFILET